MGMFYYGVWLRGHFDLLRNDDKEKRDVWLCRSRSFIRIEILTLVEREFAPTISFINLLGMCVKRAKELFAFFFVFFVNIIRRVTFGNSLRFVFVFFSILRILMGRENRENL